MVSFEESRGARWPFESVLERAVAVAALVSFVVVCSVGELGAGRTADGAIVRVVAKSSSLGDSCSTSEDECRAGIWNSGNR